MSLMPLTAAQLAARQSTLEGWLGQLTASPIQLQPVSGDASFRRYFRFVHQGVSHVAMDAPPSHEDCRPFVALADSYLAAGVQVPAIAARDLAQGFLWLRDFGDQLLLPLLTSEPAARHWYPRCLQLLPVIQQVQATADGPLPCFDEAMLRREMALFSDWLLPRHLDYHMDADELALWQQLTDLLVANALAQPQRGVHRDYHARNLMVLADDSIGVIDFQDAVVGPITYDAVSLLRDCYVAWPDELVDELLEGFRQQLLAAGETAAADAGRFRRWFDLMGMQRHLKAAGIFARLLHRDGKPGYIADIPRTVGYILAVGRRYPELQAVMGWLESRIWPLVQSRCA